MHRAMIIVGALLAAAAAQGGGREEAWKGAHRARVPDRAQIELAIDELRSAGYGRGRGGERREHGVPAPGPVPLVAVAGDAATVRWPSGEVTTLRKSDGAWTITGAPAAPQAVRPALQRSGQGSAAGATFHALDVSADHGIARLTRSAAAERLGRRLFGAPEKTASFYRVRYRQQAPFVEALYVQFVTDPAWGRVLYGSPDRWIRALPASGPTGLAADAAGRVFLGERGRGRVLVLRLDGAGENVTLRPEGSIGGMTDPTDLALDDRGTPLDTGDDQLVVADAAAHVLRTYAVGGAVPQAGAVYGGFASPTAVAVGRTNGASNGRIYVVDEAGRRLRAFLPAGGELHLLAEVRMDAASYLRSLAVDHFGSVYAVDHTGSRILKYSGLLEYLDEDGGADVYRAPAAADIPFGTVTIDGEGTYWTGFDQLFALEQWGDASGARRRRLGLALRDVRFSAEGESGAVVAAVRLTDAGEVHLRVRDARGRTIRTLPGVWMSPGTRALAWDRRDDSGRMVPPGVYRTEVSARDAYRDEEVAIAVRASLPFWYEEDCGDEREVLRPHRVTGRSVRIGDGPSGTVDEDGAAVEYRFGGVEPGVPVEVSVELPADPVVRRPQRLVVNGVTLAGGIAGGEEPVRTGWLTLPAGEVQGERLVVRVEAESGEGARVSRLWVRQSGGGFSVEAVAGEIPSAMRLEQNYPNPFNPSTRIRFALPAGGPVTLKLYTLTGAEAATLVDDHREPGMHEVVVEGGRLASGVYFYRLVQGGMTMTRKMLLLR